jgi:S1-C subfamily serine protease
MSQSSDNPLVQFSEAMADAVARAAAATVLVDARRRHPASGIAYSPDLVLTADHVVERDDDIRLVLPDGSQAAAALAGRDPGSDLAVLRVKGASLIASEPAGAEARVGQIALALGRPTSEGIQASLGVVSAIGGPLRTGRGGLLERFLRTDTIPYPGFSGGPLVDAGGKILGINTSGLWQGGALTIPASLAWPIAQAIASQGRVKRGYLGVRSQLTPLSSTLRQALGRQQEAGLLLVGVEDDSPAGRGGLLVGDILVGLQGQPLQDADDLAARLVGDLVGQPAALEVLRGGQPHTLTVIIGERK